MPLREMAPAKTQAKEKPGTEEEWRPRVTECWVGCWVDWEPTRWWSLRLVCKLGSLVLGVEWGPLVFSWAFLVGSGLSQGS